MSFVRNNINYLKLHFIVFLFGFTGILGKLITIDSFGIVGYRMLIAVISLASYLWWKNISFKVSKKAMMKIICTGLVIAVHWITFFEALKVSTVSVTLACFASTSLFTAFLEPLFFRRKINLLEVVSGLIVIGGLYLIFQFEGDYALGIFYSVLSAFLAALFTTINGLLVKKDLAEPIAFYEMTAGFFGIVLFSFCTNYDFTGLTLVGTDFIYIAILGFICTAYAFVQSVAVMTELSPFTVSISINLEPIYAIILALLIFGDEEHMSSGFYIGAMVILCTVFGNAIIKSRAKKVKP